MHNVSLHIPSGASVLVTGDFGAGKSALLRALADFCDCEGKIAFDGSSIEISAIRSGKIVACMQNSFVLPGTLEENIDGEHTEKDKAILGPLYQRIETDAATSDVSILSSGEKHRLHILHATKTSAEVLLLDEINAGLDRQSATAIFKALTSSTYPIVLAVLHDLPDDPVSLGFTHELLMHAGTTSVLLPLTHTDS